MLWSGCESGFECPCLPMGCFSTFGQAPLRFTSANMYTSHFSACFEEVYILTQGGLRYERGEESLVFGSLQRGAEAWIDGSLDWLGRETRDWTCPRFRRDLPLPSPIHAGVDYMPRFLLTAYPVYT